MKSLSLTALAVVILAACSPSAKAQPGCGSYTVCDYYKAGYHANVMWPRQFIPAARRGICETYAVMANNGWRRQNLLGDYHFEGESNKLTRAGEMKVNWILTQAPVHRRTIYVQRAASESQTSQRLASVENYGSTLSPTIAGVDVMDTHIVAEGHRASTVDSIFVGYQENRPAPVLPAATSSSSSSTGGSN